MSIRDFVGWEREDGMILARSEVKQWSCFLHLHAWELDVRNSIFDFLL